MQLAELQRKLSLPGLSCAEVCMAVGDVKDSLGLRADSHLLWQQALDASQQECWALGLKERQVADGCHHAWMLHCASPAESVLQAVMRPVVSCA